MTEELKNVREEIKGGTTPNRFSRKNFNKLAKAMINDTSYTAKVAVSKNGELVETKDIPVTEGMRKFLKKVVEKAGIDKKESEMVLDPAFRIDNVEGLYDFTSELVYNYMEAGNTFDFLPKEDFKGSINVGIVPDGETSPRDVRNPANGEIIGKFKYQNKEYKKLSASSPCPDWLKSRIKVD